MEIEVVKNIYMDQNTYIIKSNNECVVIDPGTDSKSILNKIEKNKVKYILLTHCHYDHFSGAEELSNLTGSKILCSSKCSENIKNPYINCSASLFDKNEIINNTYSINEKIIFNDNEIKMIETPGHTDCSVCYLINDNLFSGDTLFLRSVGRWDLPTGNELLLVQSIKKLFLLDDNIKVFPGHGDFTTLGYEKKYNLFVKN